MCGRYTLQSPADLLRELFETEDIPELKPRYNIAPTQDVACIVGDGGERAFANLRWGLIPFFAKDASIGQKMINARAETVAEKPSFRAAFKRRRCLVLADGFYEWKAMPDGKQPFHIARPKGQPFVFAGLYEIWKHGGGEPVRSCTIITTAANATLRALHDRMPVILEGADLDLWLDPGIQSLDSLAPLLSSVDDDYLSYRPVSRRVGNVRNDDASLLQE